MSESSKTSESIKEYFNLSACIDYIIMQYEKLPNLVVEMSRQEHSRKIKYKEYFENRFSVIEDLIEYLVTNSYTKNYSDLNKILIDFNGQYTTTTDDAVHIIQIKLVNPLITWIKFGMLPPCEEAQILLKFLLEMNQVYLDLEYNNKVKLNEFKTLLETTKDIKNKMEMYSSHLRTIAIK